MKTVNTATTPRTHSEAFNAKHNALVKARGYELPLPLTCNVTGKTVHYSNPKYIEAAITKAGSLNKLIHGFVSREGKRIQKAQFEKNHPNAARKVA